MRGETEVVVLMQKYKWNSRKRTQRTQKNGKNILPSDDSDFAAGVCRQAIGLA
jgi:hypothetical protein